MSVIKEWHEWLYEGHWGGIKIVPGWCTRIQCCRTTRLVFGDRGIFVRRSAFEQLSGYRWVICSEWIVWRVLHRFYFPPHSSNIQIFAHSAISHLFCFRKEPSLFKWILWVPRTHALSATEALSHWLLHSTPIKLVALEAWPCAVNGHF